MLCNSRNVRLPPKTFLKVILQRNIRLFRESYSFLELMLRRCMTTNGVTASAKNPPKVACFWKKNWITVEVHLQGGNDEVTPKTFYLIKLDLNHNSPIPRVSTSCHNTWLLDFFVSYICPISDSVTQDEVNFSVCDCDFAERSITKEWLL